MTDMVVRFEDVDADGDREVVVENTWLRAVFRVPETLGEAHYKHRFTWGGRLQSLVYRPTGREFLLPEMIDVEDIAPFGLPDELFASFPLSPAEEVPRRLKMGVGIFSGEGEDTVLEPLPWTWQQSESDDGECVVTFRQQVDDIDGYGYVYEKRYRFRPNSAWFALDVVWENRGTETLVSDWDIHTFHDAGEPPHSAWIVAPKRAWVTCGSTRLRTVLKEASAIHVAPVLHERVWERLQWDLDGDAWWYATGPGDGDEFFLLRARFEPYYGLWFSGYGAYTPQGISHVEVPPGERAIWGFDVTLGTGGRNFVRAGKEGGLTIDRQQEGAAVISVHSARRQRGELRVHVTDATDVVCEQSRLEGNPAPAEPLRLKVQLPRHGDLAVIDASWFGADGRALLQTQEIVSLAERRPTAHLPFCGDGTRVFVACQEDLENADTDGRYLAVNGTEAGFAVDWSEPARVRAPEDLSKYDAVCLVGDAWPLERVEELAAWVNEGGGLLVCAPFGAIAAALGDLMPLQAADDGGMEVADPVLGLQRGEPHCTAQRLMLEPDACVRIAHWLPTTPTPGALVTLRFTDAQCHPAVAVHAVGAGRVAALASRPAWGAHYNNAAWDGWGQYYRACFGGLLGWLTGCWTERIDSDD
jgi:hypothetical protein